MSRFEVCDPTMLFPFSTQNTQGNLFTAIFDLTPSLSPPFASFPSHFLVSYRPVLRLPVGSFSRSFRCNSYSCLFTHALTYTPTCAHVQLLTRPHSSPTRPTPNTHPHTLSNLWFLSSLSKVYLHLLRGAPAMVRLHLL